MYVDYNLIELTAIVATAALKSGEPNAKRLLLFSIQAWSWKRDWPVSKGPNIEVRTLTIQLVICNTPSVYFLLRSLTWG